MEGRVDPLLPPRWLAEHPELCRRGINLTDVAPEYPEADMYEELLEDRNPRNPTLPVEVLDKETRPILLMPCVSDTYDLELRQWSKSKYLQLFLQIVQAVEYLHDRNVVHGDICTGNIVVITERDAQLHKQLTAARPLVGCLCHPESSMLSLFQRPSTDDGSRT
ncbi:hypothetical protein C8Q70DRAFT_399317 [Cubamyces menziesii]|nr:hypothetical protein C8Q70DRAFT_399317 [Cubamyces menziesii]